MRKFIFLLVLSAMIFSGCQNSASVSRHGIDQTTGIGDIIAAAASESTTATIISESEETNPYGISERLANGDESVDIDLTVLSSSMIYSEVFAMVYAPEEYLGKTVKMEGIFSCFHDETTGKTYYACIVQDATQCCAQGIEFIPDESFTYPDDFPEVGSNICVTGIFGTYKEDGAQFITLKNASFSVS